MATHHLYRWIIIDPASGRTHTTRYRMSEADAKAVDPQAKRLEGSLEVRHVPDDPEALSTSAWQRGTRRQP